MDEVEHRRRRTRSPRSTDTPPDHEHAEGDPPARTVGVTPAHVAERATAGAPEPGNSSTGHPSTGHPSAAIESATVELPTVRDTTVRDPAQRSTRTRPDAGSSSRGEDRHLPFDAHTAHPINEERDGERGLRGLVGSGATQVSVSAAMRARDAARPTEADLAEAEATLAIVHRGWVPRDQPA